MHEVFKIKSLKPIPKFQQKLNNFEKPQNFSKHQILDLNAWNAWRMKRKESIPSDLKQGEFENHVSWRFWERKEY